MPFIMRLMPACLCKPAAALQASYDLACGESARRLLAPGVCLLAPLLKGVAGWGPPDPLAPSPLMGMGGYADMKRASERLWVWRARRWLCQWVAVTNDYVLNIHPTSKALLEGMAATPLLSDPGTSSSR